MKWTEERVALAVASSLFPWRRHIVVPNLSWGMGIGWEIDLGALSSANWLTEVEIKVSLADLRRDAGKWRHQYEAQPGYQSFTRKKFIAMPLDIWNKKWHPNYEFPEIPAGVGIITVEGGIVCDKAKITVVAKPIPNARKLTDSERDQMLRLGYLRYWSLREASLLAQAGLSRALEEHITKSAVAEPALADASDGDGGGSA